MASVDSPAEGPREEGSGSARQGQPAVVPATQGSESAQEVDASVVLLQPDQDSHVRDATRAMWDTGGLEGDSTLPAMQAGGGSGQAGGDATPPEDPHKVGATDAPPFFSPLNEKTHRGAAAHRVAASAEGEGARGRKQVGTGEEQSSVAVDPPHVSEQVAARSRESLAAARAASGAEWLEHARGAADGAGPRDPARAGPEVPARTPAQLEEDAKRLEAVEEHRRMMLCERRRRQLRESGKMYAREYLGADYGRLQGDSQVNALVNGLAAMTNFYRLTIQELEMEFESRFRSWNPRTEDTEMVDFENRRAADCEDAENEQATILPREPVRGGAEIVNTRTVAGTATSGRVWPKTVG